MKVRLSLTFSVTRTPKPEPEADEFDNSPTHGGVMDATIRDAGRYVGFTREEELGND